MAVSRPIATRVTPVRKMPFVTATLLHPSETLRVLRPLAEISSAWGMEPGSSTTCCTSTQGREIINCPVLFLFFVL